MCGMRTMLRSGSFIILAGILGWGVWACSFFGQEEERERIKQEFLFEFSYANWAWGYQHFGKYIDRDGQVHSYRYGSTDEPWEPEDWAHPTREELREKYSHSPYLGQVIDADTLYAKYLLIDEAAAGTYSDTLKQGADGGVFA